LKRFSVKNFEFPFQTNSVDQEGYDLLPINGINFPFERLSLRYAPDSCRVVGHIAYEFVSTNYARHVAEVDPLNIAKKVAPRALVQNMDSMIDMGFVGKQQMALLTKRNQLPCGGDG